MLGNINPLSGALAQSTQIQLREAADKAKQARLAQKLARDIGARDEDDENADPEHPVETSEEVTAVHEDGRRSDERRRRHLHKGQEEAADDEGGGGLDLEA
jgi:hypothetical protein